MGSKRCKVTGTGEMSRIIKQDERGATSSMLYAKKCTQPGKKTAGTVALHVVTELRHHSNYWAVEGHLRQVGYCNGWIQALQGRQVKKRTREERGRGRSSSEVCESFCGTDNSLAESSQLSIKGEASKGDTVAGSCYSSPDQDEEMDEALLK